MMIELNDLMLLQYNVFKRLSGIDSNYRLLNSEYRTLDFKSDEMQWHKAFIELSIPSEFTQSPKLSISLDVENPNEVSKREHIAGVVKLQVIVQGLKAQCMGYGFNFELKYNTIDEIMLNVLDVLVGAERMLPQRIADVCDTSYEIQSLFEWLQDKDVGIMCITQHYTHPKSKYIELLEMDGCLNSIEFGVEFYFSENGSLIMRYKNQYRIAQTDLSKTYTSKINYDEVLENITSTCSQQRQKK